MGRAPCCDKGSVKKGPWSPEEDRKLKEYIHNYGTGGNWIALPNKAGLRRCGKSCRLRWLNYLRPNIKHGGFSDEEDRLICGLFATIGSRWSVIAMQLPGRTDNDIKNYWNTKLKKKLIAAAGLAAPSASPPLPPPAEAALHPCFSLEQSHHHGTSSGLLMSSSSSLCSVDNAGLYFDLSSNHNNKITRDNGIAAGLESVMFGGLQLYQQQQQQQHEEEDATQGDHQHLFPEAAAETGHNVLTSDDSLPLDHYLRQYYGESGSSSYEHENKPLMISPSAGTAGTGISFFFYGDGGVPAGATATQGTRFLY